jgi:hypothetical protein
MSEARKGENNPMHGKPSPNRITEVWHNYQWILDLYIATGWSSRRICKAYNQEFGTNHSDTSKRCILGKIKKEISTN